MNPNLLESLQTPCMVIDMAQAKQNIAAMQKAADNARCALRPHIKTHKMVRFAQLQLQAGAKGITCAKIAEAEIMADGGIDDIFIAYPIIGAVKTQRLPALMKKTKRLILAVDSLAGAQGLEACAAQHGLVFEVRLELDTGAKRTGVQQDFVALAKEITALPHLHLTGIYTFKSLVYQNAPTTDAQKAAQEEGDKMQAAAEALRQAGVSIADISAGSSPTGVGVAQTGKVTEIRPGTYIFNDHMLCCEGAARPEQIAVRLYATVVSVPCAEYAVIDGGTKTFPMDISLQQPPYFYPGYGVIQGHPHLALTRMNEEHGILTVTNPAAGGTGLAVGDIVELLPVHVCTALNMQNSVYLLENNVLTQVKVDARGALT